LAAAVSSSADEPRLRALAVLRRHGRSTVSFQLLEPGFRYFFEADAPAERAGFVAYVDTGGAWVGGGAPIGPDDRLAAIARAFAAAARAARRRACFFGVEEGEREALGLASLTLGVQPFWTPDGWERTLASNASLRYQLRRASKKGVRVRAVEPHELADHGSPARRGIQRVIERWQRGRPMAPMGFLVDLHPFGFASERMTFVAERGGRVVGFLAAVPIYARRGWFLEDLLRADDAPNGTAELLVDAALREAAARGASLATMGLAPLAGDVARPLALIRDLSRGLYDFRGLHAFKRKLAPTRWEPIYLCTPGARWIALYDALVAFARGSMLRFGLQSLLRGPDVAVRGFTFALAAWIAIVAADATPWLPSSAAKWAWILAHLALLGALGALIRRHRGWLALALAAMLAGDAIATLAYLGNPGVRGLTLRALLAALIACVGPALTSLAVWATWRRRRAA
jgi:phosphatidylglycerol lysyltransferase